MTKTAILVDGGFYRRKAQSLWGEKRAAERVKELIDYCYRHLYGKRETAELYRIFYYDCPPMETSVYHPFTKQNVDFRHTELYTWMTEFLETLTFKRKVALRLGELSDTQAHYNIYPQVLKKLCKDKIKFEDLTENDFKLYVDQKGVDMKIGVDIASMSYKKQVDRIVLISGDSDFVPAAKLARREGIDFVLDPMGNNIKKNLQEHVDGVYSRFKTTSEKPEK